MLTRKRSPIKISDIGSSDERASAFVSSFLTDRKAVIELMGVHMTSKRARFLAQWLLDNADWVDEKNMDIRLRAK